MPVRCAQFHRDPDSWGQRDKQQQSGGSCGKESPSFGASAKRGRHFQGVGMAHWGCHLAPASEPLSFSAGGKPALLSAKPRLPPQRPPEQPKKGSPSSLPPPQPREGLDQQGPSCTHPVVK